MLRPKKLSTRVIVIVAITAFALVAAGAGILWARHSRRPPNIVILVLDTVRDDHVGAAWQGTPLTPAVDAMAAEGTRFVNAFAPAPWTVPAHASLFTGLYPHVHQAVHEKFVLAPSYVTLAELTRAKGYQSLGITCNPWLTQNLGFAQGFDTYAELFREPKPAEDAAEASRLAIEWLRGPSAGDRPFLLFINYLEAHLPYEPDARTLERLPPSPGSPRKTRYTIEDAERVIGRLGPVAPEEIDDARRLYAAEIAYQDTQVARVLEHLRAAEQLDHTIVVIAADHGEHLSEHGLMGHEFTLYEPVLRVPLIVRYPKAFPPGARVVAPVSLIDVLPTLIELANLDEPGRPLPGRSLARTDGQAPPRALLSEYAQPVRLITQYWRSRYPQLDMSAYDTSLRAVHLGDWKYIINGETQERLFNLADDAREERDLSTTEPETLARMRAALAELEQAR